MMERPDARCDGCGTPITQPPRCRRVRWCSDRCRKQTLYGGQPCRRCGAPRGANGSDGNHADRLCPACARADFAVAAAAQHARHVREWEAMWAAGLKHAEIAAATGWTVKGVGAQITRLRAEGHNFPYRRPSAIENGRRVAAASAAARASRA
jgi:hypothetical protein